MNVENIQALYVLAFSKLLFACTGRIQANMTVSYGETNLNYVYTYKTNVMQIVLCLMDSMLVFF